MKKEKYQVYYTKQEITREIHCEYQQLRKQVSNYENGIPFDCQLLIDNNKQVYSATQLISQTSKSFQLYDIRDIFYENQLRQQQQQQQMLQNPDDANEEIKKLKVKLYDQDQQIQKKDKEISKLKIDLNIQKDQLEKKIEELKQQNQSLNEEKQKNEQNFGILIDEKIQKITSIKQKKKDGERFYKNEIEKYQQQLYDKQLELQEQQSNHKQEIETIQQKDNKLIQQLQEELSLEKEKLIGKEQEITDMRMAFKEGTKDMGEGLAFKLQLTDLALNILKREHEKITLENFELKSKINNLTKQLNDQQKNATKDPQTE